nr:hypothetical protein Ade03nite_94950 [Actinoplanes derwentensis]
MPFATWALSKPIFAGLMLIRPELKDMGQNTVATADVSRETLGAQVMRSWS